MFTMIKRPPLRSVIVNRWFKASGQRKRVDDLFSHFQHDADAIKNKLVPFDAIAVTAYLKKTYGGTLHEAVCMMVAFVGLYNNEDSSQLFTEDRYDSGIKLWQSIIDPK